MKAMVCTKYGPPEVLKWMDVEKPFPKDNEVLIKVHACSLNAFDWRMLTADPFFIRLMGDGLQKPKYKILGADIAGRVEATGSQVSQFKPGDDVFGDISPSGCGGLGEYACAREDILVKKPTQLSFIQAAAVPMAALTVLQGLRDKGHIMPGQKVLIQGASGGVGTFGVQIAKSYGAEVTAVCSTGNMDNMRSLGADHVIDYTKEDFTKNGQRYDLILAANGYHPITAYKRTLSPNGIYVMAGGSMGQLFQAMLFGPLMSKKGGKTMGGVSAHVSQQDLEFLKDLLELGKIVPYIDRCYTLQEAAEAFRYIGTGHAKGKIVITVVPQEGN